MENIKNILSDKLNLLLIMSGLYLCFMLFSLFSKGEEEQKVDYIKKEITLLKDEIKAIYESEKALDKKIDTFNTRIQRIHEAVNINNIKIENLKKYEKTQIDKFKSYDARMWEKYFAERYANKTSSRTNTAK
jgi:septal ring factor EnvC (AmiA/AmiB activator)